jgi:hypothetical protein
MMHLRTTDAERRTLERSQFSGWKIQFHGAGRLSAKKPLDLFPDREPAVPTPKGSAKTLHSGVVFFVDVPEQLDAPRRDCPT